MENSDLFLELFDDDQLRPQKDILEICLGKSQTKPEDALSNTNENSAPSGSSCNSSEEIGPGDKTSKKPIRTEFDFCSALDDVKKEREKKYNKMVAKIKGEKKMDLSGEKSLLHHGDTDSSEDEDNKYMESCNYNSFGVEIKRLLHESAKNNASEDESFDDPPVSAASFHMKSEYKTNNSCSNLNNSNQLSLAEKRTENSCNDYVDPFFGIRIMEPVISREGMRIRMGGKVAVRLSQLQVHLAKAPETDFVVAGVLVRSVTKRAQNETQYMIWELSELKEDKANTSVFLFGQSYKQLWKIPVPTVVALLNPTTNNNKGKPSDSVSLVVKQADQVMIWGKSKDYALCKSMKKNGEKCSAVVNRSICEYCVYHVSKEYSKFSSSRPYAANNGSNFLRNKVLGKNEVFYGGKSYTAMKGSPPAGGVKVKEKKNKVIVEDKQRLAGLGWSVPINRPPPLTTNSVSLPYSRRAAEALRAVNVDSHILKSLSSGGRNVGVENMRDSGCSQSKDSERATTRTAVPALTDIYRAPTLTDPSLDDHCTDNNQITAHRLSSNTHITEKFLSETTGKSKKAERGSSVSASHIHTDTSNRITSHSEPCFPPQTDQNIKDSEGGASDFPRKSSHSVPKVSRVSTISTLSSDTTTYTGKDLQQKFKSLFDVASADVSAKMKSADSKSSNSLHSEVGRSEGCSSRRIKAPLDTKPEAGCGSQDSCAPASGTPLPGVQHLVTNTQLSRTNMSKAKIRAMMFVQRNGPIAKEDPNKSEPSKSRKRERPSDSNQETSDASKLVFSELYLQLMRQTSQQQDLVEAEKLRQEQQYFDKMGLREQLEEKMLNTFKIDCKAVKCLQCKYIWFSAADMCKAQRHTLKIVDAVKRFFKCGNCSNRTVSLHVLPVFSCTNCHSSNWQRAPMMREKICKNENGLSIRGGEQKFTNSQVTNTNLNLLVPE